MNSRSAKKQRKGNGGVANPTPALSAIVKECIIAGIEKAYRKYQGIKAQMNVPPTSITEYLITASVAQELWTADSLKSDGDIFVQVECSATDFVNNAFERFKFKPYRRRDIHQTIRTGRIDIGVLRFGMHLGFRSVVGIELKGFNPPQNKVYADLRRLIHAMNERDAIGKNSIVASFCAFVMSLKKRNELLNACEIEPRKRALQKELGRNLKGILRNSSRLQKIIHVWNIDVEGSDEVARRTPEEFRDQNDIASETRAIVGVLVTIKRKYSVR